MHTADSLIECKTVLQGNKQITIRLEDLKSLSYHAAIADQQPVLHIEIDKQRWVLITESDYEAWKSSDE
jgi:Holliday junction resolvase